MIAEDAHTYYLHCLGNYDYVPAISLQLAFAALRGLGRPVEIIFLLAIEI